MRFTIVYASATGHTEDIAERLKVLLLGSELKDLDRIDFTKELEESEALICCTPTWNTGSESKRSGTSWDEHIENIKDVLKNKWGFDGAVVSDWGAIRPVSYTHLTLPTKA